MSLADSTKIPRICAVVETLGITDVYVQAVVGGYAYYDSRVIPRSEVLVRAAGPDYVPFDTVCRLLKRRGIRIHAWVNALLAWSLEKKPDSSTHVLNRHPEWFLRDVFGRSMSEYSFRDWRRYGAEGLFLDPAIPAVREYIADIVRDIVHRYDVDGVHLDFIRYPGIWWSVGEGDPACLLQGMTSDTLQWMTLVRYTQLSFPLRWTAWNIWRLIMGREKNVEAAVREAFEGAAVGNRSCAVVANPASAGYKYGQAWWRWRDVMDYPVLMSYTQDVALFGDMLDFALGKEKDAVGGIGVIWPAMERAAAYEKRAAVRRGAGGYCYFDFESLDTLAELTLLMDTTDIPADSMLADSARYRPVSSAFKDRPASVYKICPDRARDQEGADEFCRFILSLSLDPARDIGRLGLDASSFASLIRDDVAAFEYVNAEVFPVSTLTEPAVRSISYDSLCWGQEDSGTVRNRIRKIKELNYQRRIVPLPLDRLAKAVYNADPHVRSFVETADCVYAFTVDRIDEGRGDTPAYLVPVGMEPLYRYCTVQKKIEELLR